MTALHAEFSGSKVCCNFSNFDANGKHWRSLKLHANGFDATFRHESKTFYLHQRLRAVLISPSTAAQKSLHVSLVASPVAALPHTCVARAGLWKTDGGLGAQVAPPRELPNQPRVRESATPTTKKNNQLTFCRKPVRRTQRGGVALGLRERKLLGVVFWGVVPLCWLLLSCVESAISVLGRG